MATLQIGTLGQMKTSSITSGSRKLFSKLISGSKESTARYARGFSKPSLR